MTEITLDLTSIRKVSLYNEYSMTPTSVHYLNPHDRYRTMCDELLGQHLYYVNTALRLSCGRCAMLIERYI
jgi:hypothetical protein